MVKLWSYEALDFEDENWWRCFLVGEGRKGAILASHVRVIEAFVFSYSRMRTSFKDERIFGLRALESLKMEIKARNNNAGARVGARGKICWSRCTIIRHDLGVQQS